MCVSTPVVTDLVHEALSDLGLLPVPRPRFAVISIVRLAASRESHGPDERWEAAVTSL
jgi:hypothetical protein